jgi:hypothetical protein
MTDNQLQNPNERFKRYVFKFECSQTWENLTETNDERVRHCEHCRTDVFSVQNDGELFSNAEKGNCIYLPPMRTAGIPFMPDESEK